MKNISNLGKKIVRQRDKTDDKQETLGAGFDYRNGNLKKHKYIKILHNNHILKEVNISEHVLSLYSLRLWITIVVPPTRNYYSFYRNCDAASVGVFDCYPFTFALTNG